MAKRYHPLLSESDIPREAEKCRRRLPRTYTKEMSIWCPIHCASLHANRAVQKEGCNAWWRRSTIPLPRPSGYVLVKSSTQLPFCRQQEYPTTKEQCRSPRTRSPQPQLGRYHIAIAVLRAFSSPRQWPDVAGHKQGCCCMTSARAARRPCRLTSTPRCPARPLLSRDGQRISQAGSHRRVRNGRSLVADDANGNEHI